MADTLAEWSKCVVGSDFDNPKGPVERDRLVYLFGERMKVRSKLHR